ncbi:Short-chain dehydrogenase/reductase (SDR); putative 3-oxoacyl-[acyl-carrier-protein] reductase / 3-ketoacyl-[acyl-carrier-protein] reductase [Pseudorhizobium banfieldiae]|uniref:Short-chain dehydrogenase/reductase (SDR) putative 3-oxoacyl-[acyl-carrier-protein] reductase / 3-ketoacyl-[acyl-carrier-protein] reductase n=1 Tax=Pseudorhizobium banfieldiae TaxID=1125847 RepID=L0NC42_9HYPH|nr:SDR family oxidoreductase [Pseudorhizobium banfieldiae]CAD6598564.1 NAD(P)-dependent oxidoreductase [arsenite-oxidising bacterium NT-25]CCF17902.1 Short-chain dehydrogenase/reductase (SDR); putative 3-oxoacyl-[acyl-carrier-protein] reductase / 3-ketoacyl-[acyl-carrier-protein] reductase [Pseudorhizobium banfieldiae]
MRRLEGKVAIITGAGCVAPGWGNGRAAAVLFAKEGATVVGTDINTDAMEETARMLRDIGGAFHLTHCDVTDSSSIAGMVEDVMSRYGRVDVLVNNVGGSAKGGAVEMSEELWLKQLNYNLTSVFLMCKHVLPIMKAQESGSIVNTASTSGIRWTGAAQVAYAAAKAGVIQLSRVTAVEYAPFNVRVNTVVPGQMHTPMVEARLATQRAGGDVSALLAQRQSRIPLPFMGDGRDTANAALFLASDDARFVTGTELVVDGGMSARCD